MASGKIRTWNGDRGLVNLLYITVGNTISLIYMSTKLSAADSSIKHFLIYKF
jgi:hypothetical protein